MGGDGAMEIICPLCNGLREFQIDCEKCREGMKDRGRIAEYYDNYSSYLDISITELIDGVCNDECVHIFTCKNCNHDKRVSIDKIFN